MNRQLFTKVNGVVKKYDIVLDFTSNETHQNYIVYTDNTKESNNIILYSGIYTIEDGIYVIKEIKNDKEKEIINNIINDLNLFANK